MGGARGEAVRYEDQLKIGGKFEGLSSYAQEYANKGPQRRPDKAVIASNQIMPVGQFSDISTYSGTYVGNAAQRSVAVKKEGELKVGGKWEGSSTYNQAYEGLQSPERREKVVYTDNGVMPRG
ncbi:unnamed protein product [Sphagnum balticum]